MLPSYGPSFNSAASSADTALIVMRHFSLCVCIDFFFFFTSFPMADEISRCLPVLGEFPLDMIYWEGSSGSHPAFHIHESNRFLELNSAAIKEACLYVVKSVSLFTLRGGMIYSDHQQYQ